MAFGPNYTEDELQKLRDRVAQLETEVKTLKQKYHDADIPEIHYRLNLGGSPDTLW